MSIDLGRRLIAAGLVPPEEVEAALFFSVARGVPFARVLIDRGAITERGLEEELERLGGLGLRQVAGAPELVERVPRAMCRRLAALPTRLDPQTGTIDVAAADPLDPHIPQEFGFHLGAPIRVLRAPIAAVEEAIRRLELTEPEAAAPPRQRRKTPPFPHGAPTSSNPPPSLDEAPIPLVRKAGTSAEGQANRGRAARRETEPAPAFSGRAAPVAVPAPFTMGSASDGPKSPHRATIRPRVAPSPPPRRPASAAPEEPVPARDAVVPEPEGHAATSAPPDADAPPAVSFPSVPPDGSGDRHTPPYGTPALAPPAAPLEIGARSRHDTPVEARGSGSASGPAPRAPRAPLPAADDSLAAAVEAATSEPPEEPEPASEEQPPEEPAVVRAVDGGPVLDALEHASDRDEIIRLAMRGMRLCARRIGVFAVKRGGFYGYRCNVELGDQDAFREVVVPSDQPSVLATATATAIYLGPIPATPAHEALLAVMETASNDVAVVAARAAGRPALLMLADGLDDTMMSTRFIVDLARAVGDALTRALASR